MVPNWTSKDYARWEEALGVSPQEIKRRAKERKKQKKLSDSLVNPYEHICQHCGCTFIAKFPYKYCGTINGCLQDKTGKTKEEMAS